MKFKFGFLLLFVGILGLVIWGYRGIYSPMASDEKAETLYFQVEIGDSPAMIASNLKDKSLIRSEFLFTSYLKYKNLDNKLQAGNYELSTNWNVVKIIEILQSGKVWEDQLLLQIKEGENLFEVYDYLSELDFDMSKWESLNKISYWQDKYTFLTGVNPDNSLEGYFFPDTYYFSKDSDLEDVFIKVLDHFGKKTATLRLEAKEKGLLWYDVLILASVVEWEVRTPANRALVADIFWRRYKDNYLLQSDATLNYFKSKEERIDRHSGEELLAEDNPYNTYKHIGLPPTPVNNPSLGAMEATVNPEPSNYYFFLTTPDGNIHYAETYEEHLENTRLYLN